MDWEARVNFERLRQECLARVQSALKRSDMGALLCFDMTNIRYITATHIGTWAMDKLMRFTLLPQAKEPLMWDFGSASARVPALPGCAERLHLQIEHSRHRSVANFLVNLLDGLIAYCHQPKKPALHLTALPVVEAA